MTGTRESNPTGERESAPRLLKFSEFSIGVNNLEELNGIEGPVVDELAKVFDVEKPEYGWDVDSLGELIGAIARDKELQNNIPAIEEIVPGFDGRQLAVKFVEETGLLEEVKRNYFDPEAPMPIDYVKAIITGGVRNWMMRRAHKLIEEIKEGTANVEEVVLVGGQRVMGVQEGPDVEEGFTEGEYLEKVIKPLLEDNGISVSVLKPETKDGNEIAKVIAESLQDENGPILLSTNAGNWVQNGGQIARAMGEEGSQRLYVISDTFPVAKDGEPPATHQNPLTALGVIARNLQEFERHRRN